MANASDAVVEAIYLFTYNGEDPYLIHEPACQKCHAKKSQKPLTRCSGCSLVWYCSKECIEADTVKHRKYCANIVRHKATIEARKQELRNQYQIEDAYVPSKNIPSAAKHAHTELEQALTSTIRNVYKLASQAETKGLWETTLDLYQKLFKMKERRSAESLRKASNIAFILIRLGRLEDAWHFIRNTMVTYKKRSGSSPVVIEYDTQDRYADCLGWVRSSYPLSKDAWDFDRQLQQASFHRLIMALIIIKLRIQIVAARNKWKNTINIFLQTKQGQELEPARFALQEWFSFSDDTVQPKQIRQLMEFLHSFDPPTIPDALKNQGSLGSAATCLHRTPKGPDLLSTELASPGFERRVKQLKAARAAARAAAGLAKEKAKWFAFVIFIDCIRRYVSIPFIIGFACASLYALGTIYDFVRNVEYISKKRGWKNAARLADSVQPKVVPRFTLGSMWTLGLCAGEMEDPTSECPRTDIGIIWIMTLVLRVVNIFLAYIRMRYYG